VTKYAAGASGNAAPIAVITCGGLNLPDGVATDSASNVYVANLQGGSISIFRPDANGCAKAAHIIGRRTKLSRPSALMISGSTIFVGNLNSHAITEYPASARGNVAPSAQIIGASTMLVNPVGIASDAKHNLYVTDDSAQAIFVFAAGANGNVAPIRTIQGSNTQLNGPSGIVVTGRGITVTNPASNSIATFPLMANGNVAPTRVIQGSATQLNFPIGLAIH
jgi:sugar lactone lactonase YvrE